MVSKFRKIKKINPREGIFFSIILALLFLGVIVFLVVTNLQIEKRRDKLQAWTESLKKEIQILEEKNEKLKTQISEAGTQDFLERVAREELNLKSPGEEVVVISKEEEKKSNNEEQNSPPAQEKKKPWDPRAWWEWIKSKF